jgi:hydroxyacylglutathione hydrolase
MPIPQQPVTDYAHGISAVESGFNRPFLAAVHLIVEQGRVALVDTGTHDSVARVLLAIEGKGLTAEDVDYVLLTHVHLDHAGGAGQFMRLFPNAKLVVHPRGAPHMIDPSKLWNATVAVYGEALARKSYGEILPIPAERVLQAGEGFSVELAGRRLEFFDTPGHARHHLCIRDTRSGAIFTGDTFGLSYRELDRDGLCFIFPSTTPTQFDPPALHASVDRILAFKPPAVYLTHYAEVREVPRLGADMHRLIDAHVAVAERAREMPAGAQRLAALEAGLAAVVDDECRLQRWPMSEAEARNVFVNDIELNAAGLEAWLGSRSQGASA